MHASVQTAAHTNVCTPHKHVTYLLIFLCLDTPLDWQGAEAANTSGVQVQHATIDSTLRYPPRQNANYTRRDQACL